MSRMSKYPQTESELAMAQDWERRLAPDS
jgi:hypothetical protein